MARKLRPLATTPRTSMKSVSKDHLPTELEFTGKFLEGRFGEPREALSYFQELLSAHFGRASLQN
jgi:hypothetical protein